MKEDFWIKETDGSYKKHSRGSVKGLDGEWRRRSRKHRYVLIFDKSLNMLWAEHKIDKDFDALKEKNT